MLYPCKQYKFYILAEHNLFTFFHLLDSFANSKYRLNGRVAVITGGATGTGAATAKLFAENGAHVVVADVLDEQGTSLAESIQGLYIHCNVSNELDVESAVQLAVTWKGKLDIMFNSAGLEGNVGTITNLNIKEMTDLLSINLNGVVHGIKHASRAMIVGGKGGSIICTSSTAALMGGLGSHPYTLSKEAIVGVARSAACELGVHGIRVNCVLPHGSPSQEMSNAAEERGSLIKGRGGRAEDVAYAALFLASDEESGFITGHNLVIDGGYTRGCSQMTFIY